MLRLIILILLFASQPALAADLWKKDCDEDLSWALDTNLLDVELAFDRSGKFDNRVPRTLGAENALCIDELIAAAEQYDWQEYKKYRQKFIAELKWVRDLFRGDMGVVYRLAENYRDHDDGILDKTLSLFFLHWAADNKYPPRRI